MLLKDCVGGLAAHRSEADKQARLVKRKMCLISDAGSWVGWVGALAHICPKAESPPPPPTDKHCVKSFYRQKVGEGGGWVGLNIETGVSSDK